MPVRIPRIPRLARGHALAPGLACAVVPTAGGSMVDLCHDRGSGAAGGVVDSGTYGLAARDWGLGAAWPDLQFTTGAFTVAALAWLRHGFVSGEYPGFFSSFAYVSETNNQGWALQFRGDAVSWSFTCGRNGASGSTQESVTSSANATVGDHLILGTSNGSNSRTIYVDGVGRTTQSNFVNPLATTQAIGNGSSATIQIPIYYGMCWNRSLSNAEVAYLYSVGGVELLSARRHRIGWTAALAAPAPAARPAAQMMAM